MKVIIWGINYSPELTGIGPYNKMVADHLISEGHEVHVVTSFPYYPSWEKTDFDKFTIIRHEITRTLHVWRVWLYVPKSPRTVSRIYHELSFIVNSFWIALYLHMHRRFDSMFIVSPPLGLGFVAGVLSKIFRVPMWLHIQDLQPDASEGLGMIKDGRIMKLLRMVEWANYSMARIVSGICDEMNNRIIEKCDRNKVKLLKNPIPIFHCVKNKKSFRKDNGIEDSVFIIAYAGNIGKKQGLEWIVKAASRLNANLIQLIIAGDGAEKVAITTMIKALQSDAVKCLPILSQESYENFMIEADIHLIAQKSGTGKFFFPSKYLASLAFGKSCLVVADETSSIANEVRTYKTGLIVSKHEPEELSGMFEKLADNRKEIEVMESNARKRALDFNRAKILREFSDNLSRMRDNL